MNTLAEPPIKTAGRSEKDIITGLQNIVSASRLTLFLQCRLKFFFRYVLDLSKPATPSLHVGNTVHAVLKAWNRARWRDQPMSLKELHDTYTTAWNDPNQSPVIWEPGEEEDQKQTGWRLCDTYLRESNIPPDVKPDAVEVPVEAELSKFGLPKLVGILDLVQQRQIIDYKTSATTPNAERIGHTTEAQTSSYAVLYREATSHKEAGIQLHHLVKLKNPKLVITQLPAMSDQQRARLFHLMEAYVEGLQRRDFVPSPGLQCHGCEFYHECRAWQ
jgi:putative RecB family exonuclease